jgi:hypothetical protein
MSCQHGNPLDTCDLCDELLAEFRCGVEQGKKDGWEACETCHWIVDGKHTEAESLREQLAERENQIAMLRTAIDRQPYTMDKEVCEALRATADLSGRIICDAEPAGTFLGCVEEGKAFQATHPNAYPLYKELAK